MKKKDLTWIYIGHKYEGENKNIFDFLQEKGIKFVFCPTENDFWKYIIQKESLDEFGIAMDAIPDYWPIHRICIPKIWGNEEKKYPYDYVPYLYGITFYEKAILPHKKLPLIILCDQPIWLTPSLKHGANELRKKGIKVNFLNAWRYMEEYERIFEGE